VAEALRQLRVARAPEPWRWPDWNSAHEDGTFGSRLDEPRGEYRMLYASSERAGAFAEALARFRVDLRVAAEQQAIDGEPEDAGYPEPLAGGVVPIEWTETRLLGAARYLFESTAATITAPPSQASGASPGSATARRDPRSNSTGWRSHVLPTHSARHEGAGASAS
jgi:hypothetical protein